MNDVASGDDDRVSLMVDHQSTVVGNALGQADELGAIGEVHGDLAADGDAG
jgi:hypothetical protein